MSNMSVVWTGADEMNRKIDALPDQYTQALVRIATYWAAVMETYAKQNASWTDRTGIARQSLHTIVEQLGKDTVNLYLSHGVDYGIFLEVRWAGRYAIIWPTIEAHLPKINTMLQEVFGS